MEAQVKLNPVRIRVPKYGNGLMLLMEYSSRCSGRFLGKVTDQEDQYFDVEIQGTKAVAQGVKKYINNNL